MKYAGTFIAGMCEIGIEFPWSMCGNGTGFFPSDRNVLNSHKCSQREKSARVRQNGLTHIVRADKCARS